MNKYEMICQRAHAGGVQRVYRCDNGFGASLVRHSFSYGREKGLWELAVIKFDGNEWEITYETPITDDVCGYMTQDMVFNTLAEISRL